MIIKNILKTLSDGEIMAIANQLADVTVNEQMVYKQLIAKGNRCETVEEMYKEMNSDNVRGTLPRLVALELSNRYRSLIMEKSNLNLKS
jgi:hypothetical protein